MKKIEQAIQLYYNRLEKLLGILPVRLGPLLMLFYRCPFNGQQKRQELFDELLNLSFEAVVETGMFIGSTTAYFGGACAGPVYGVEINPVYHWLARARLKRLSNVHPVVNDSRKFLGSIRDDNTFPKKNVLFYLDAHGAGDIPLEKEVAIITGAWSEFVIVIDDFQVPGDSGYHFDDYGGRGVYSLGCFDFAHIGNVALFSPTASSAFETGFRRGAILLVSRDAILPKVARMKNVQMHTSR